MSTVEGHKYRRGVWKATNRPTRPGLTFEPNLLGQPRRDDPVGLQAEPEALAGSAFAFDEQPRLAGRAFDIAERTGAKIVRVFTYWRTIDPGACFDRVAAALRGLADQALDRGLVIGVENEHACNIATGEETARLLAAADHPALQAIWDPANALVAGETPFPDGYEHIPTSRIIHVHAKDCSVTDRVPTFGPLGEMGIDWRGQLAALANDGYHGTVSLETHWKGPNGDKFQGSVICGRALNEMVRAVGGREPKEKENVENRKSQ